MRIRDYILFALAGYLWGSVLFAYWIPRLFQRVDTTAASEDGNPGVFNAFHYAGRLCGFSALICEIAKGCLPVFFAAARLDPKDLLFALVMVAPVLGHVFPLWNRFKGGKGIAVSFGVLLGLFPMKLPFSLLAGLYIFFSTVLIVDTHLWRSVLVFNLFAACALLFIRVYGVRLGCLAICALVVAKHLLKTEGERFSVRPFWRRGAREMN